MQLPIWKIFDAFLRFSPAINMSNWTNSRHSHRLIAVVVVIIIIVLFIVYFYCATVHVLYFITSSINIILWTLWTHEVVHPNGILNERCISMRAMIRLFNRPIVYTKYTRTQHTSSNDLRWPASYGIVSYHSAHIHLFGAATHKTLFDSCHIHEFSWLICN